MMAIMEYYRFSNAAVLYHQQSTAVREASPFMQRFFSWFVLVFSYFERPLIDFDDYK
mgnify:FL=1